MKKGGARHESLRDSAAIELGLHALLEEGGFTAFTTTFEDLHGMKQLPGLAVQRLMEDGYGFAGEGDWTTAALVRIMKVMAFGLPGGPSLLGGPPAPAATKDEPAPAAKVEVPTPAAIPADTSVPQANQPPAAPARPAEAAASAMPVPEQKLRIETDRIRADIDLAGAVVSRAELLQQRVAPDWTASGLLSLVTGKRQDPDANVVLLDVSPNRVYVAQSGMIGGPELPTHRTPFVKVDGPDAKVQVSKRAGTLYVNVVETAEDHATVNVTLPMSMIDALKFDDANQIDVAALLTGLDQLPNGDLVTVEADDATVRVWVE